MIMARAPFRVSFVGGGTDFEDYYKLDYGQVISATINKYIYVTILKRMDNKIHLRYSGFEFVDNIDQLKHDLVREAMRMTGVESGVEIVIISDIPARGSGLGSSSALANALIAAMVKFQHNFGLNKMDLAELSCILEIDKLKNPIGKQDQYATAMGGLNEIYFSKNNIFVTELKKVPNLEWLEKATMLFYLNSGRRSGDILTEHQNGIEQKIDILNSQRQLVTDFKKWIYECWKLAPVGKLINDSWKYKVAMTSAASNEQIEELIRKILLAGAYGVKVCGAGGGGFMLVVCDPKFQDQVRTAAELPELKFKFETEGTGVVYED